ncbi:MAG: hypothetical protein H7A35_09575 [Planctomycetales bacterium]|nr:hypothetical protein [bacterium]UNM07127.1 MAG: hypothetical protein H7A35_09575 [Planctomycetales bacterium]
MLALAIFALVSLLAGIQAGDIELSAMLPAGKPAKKAAKNESPLLLAKPVELGVDESADPASPDEAAAADESAMDVAAVVDPEGATRIDGRTRQLICKALGRMDPMLAAERISALNDNDATLVLSCQKKRELAHILEFAKPEDAANWINILLQMDDAQALLPPGESILDQVNESLATPDPAEPGIDPSVQPTADSGMATLPDFMLSPEEHAAFLAQFPQYRADIDGSDNSVIPVISDFTLDD